MPDESLEELERRLAQLYEQVAGTGDFRPGSVSEAQPAPLAAGDGAPPAGGEAVPDLAVAITARKLVPLLPDRRPPRSARAATTRPLNLLRIWHAPTRLLGHLITSALDPKVRGYGSAPHRVHD